MDHRKISQEIVSALNLAIPPVALTFVDGQPEGIEIIEGEVPSFCAFWRLAETQVFYAPADKHYNCPIGAMVLGIDMPPEVQEELKTLVEKMCHSSYLCEDEPANIPTLSNQKGGVVYGPLKDFPIEPQLILMWLTPAQAMIFNEALGSCKWAESSQTMALGRPACTAIPTALNQSSFAQSLGCAGMRTFTEIGDDQILAILNFREADSFLENMKVTLAANKEMEKYYLGKKNEFAK